MTGSDLDGNRVRVFCNGSKTIPEGNSGTKVQDPPHQNASHLELANLSTGLRIVQETKHSSEPCHDENTSPKFQVPDRSFPCESLSTTDGIFCLFLQISVHRGNPESLNLTGHRSSETVSSLSAPKAQWTVEYLPVLKPLLWVEHARETQDASVNSGWSSANFLAKRLMTRIRFFRSALSP